MGRWAKLGVAAVLITATALFGFMGNSAHAKNALCPKTCLTVGALLGGQTRSGVAAQSVSHEYDYSWTAIDLTEQLPQYFQISIHLSATGYVKNNTFYGVGDVVLSPDGYYYDQYAHVRVTDNGKTVHMDGGGFTLNATSLLGAGAAQYKTAYDYDWDYYST